MIEGRKPARLANGFSRSDGSGECDCSFRAGPPGFIRVLDDRTIDYPDYRGNGVMASLGNMLEIPQADNPGRRPVQWIMVHVTEAYIHC